MNDETTSAFKELYEEIDRLCNQSVDGWRLESRNDTPPKPVEILKNEDIDELIEYSKKFVEKTRSEIKKCDFKNLAEHGVQCVRTEKKSNKKLNTPPKWIAEQKKEAVGTNRATAIQIIRRIPKERKDQDHQLNNQRPASQVKQVRNIGTNVNFIHRKSIKLSNNATTPEAICPRASRTTPPVIKKPVTPQSSGKIYRFYCSKLSPSQLWEQQHPELAYESSERSVFPRRMKKSDFVAKEKESTAVGDRKELKIVHLTDGLEDCNKAAPDQLEKPKEDVAAVLEEPSVSEVPKTTRAITKHTIPSINIKGDWKVNLQVQETCRINILDKKSDGNPACSNLKYVEIKYGMPEKAEPLTETCAKVDSPIEETELPEEFASVQVIKVPKSAQKVAKAAKNSSINKYLQPFVNLQKSSTEAPKPSLIVDLTDSSDSSSESSLDGIVLQSDSSESCSTEDVRGLIKCAPREKKPKKALSKTAEAIQANLSGEVPRLVSPTKSVQLQVPSPPCRLESPPKPRSPPLPPVSTRSRDFEQCIEPASEASGSSKFLENLRIWKSAVQVQSENMKLGNQLSENLDILKQNMEVITTETQNISKITENCEKNLKQIEGLKERYAKNFGTSPVASVPLDYPECSSFGCKPGVADCLVQESPAYDHKAFQRVVLEQSPRYSKTIQKICEEGRSRKFKQADSATASREVVERAAQKFLQSCSRSVSRISYPQEMVSSTGSHSPGSVRSWDGSYQSGGSGSGISDDDDDEDDDGGDHASVSSSWMVGVRGSNGASGSFSNELFQRRIGNTSDSSSSYSDKSSSVDQRRMRKSLSDEGEVLSQGEVR